MSPGILNRILSPSPIVELPLEFTQAKEQTGITITYVPYPGGSISIAAVSHGRTPLVFTFPPAKRDEAHILYMEVTELLQSRAQLGQDAAAIFRAIESLFSAFRGEYIPSEASPASAVHPPAAECVANPGKSLVIDVDGTAYLRLPIKTRLITTRDTDILPIIDVYVRPYLKDGDMVFLSEKALCITQGLVKDMGEVRPTPLARFLARHVGNYYGTSDFHGFGHGTDLAMQLFIEEAGYPRILLAAAVSAITRPLGIRGLFYLICGKRAKSIDCPMSFLILEYAHSVKLAPNDPSGVARKIKKMLGHETVILDANYRGAFSLGKSSRAISESFIGKLFRDNPLGQSDEMTPLCIVRKAEAAQG